MGPLSVPVLARKRTNKCTNTNVDPQSTAGLSLSGAGTGVLSVVDDSAALAAIGRSGNAYRLDNTASAAATFVSFPGFTGNVHTHAGSVFVRGSGAGSLRGSGITAEGSFAFTATAGYERQGVVLGALTGSRQLQLQVNAGADLYFILNQLEEGAVATSPPIVVRGAAATVYN